MASMVIKNFLSPQKELSDGFIDASIIKEDQFMIHLAFKLLSVLCLHVAKKLVVWSFNEDLRK